MPLSKLDLTQFPDDRSARSRFQQILKIALASLSALVLLIVVSIQTSAQGATAPIEHLEVALWPEFDRSAMLVIYRFELASDTPLPARVALPVPAASGQPHAVAWLSADGGLFDADFTTEASGIWTIVEIELPGSRSGQLEYYADMDFAGTTRSFLFDWPSGYELGGMSYEVQEPVAATDLAVSPAPDSEGLGDYGLNYLSAELGAQPVDSAPVISVTYQKATPTLSIESLQPLGQISVPIESQLETLNILPWLAGAAGIVLLGGGAYYFVSQRRPAPQRVPRRRGKRTTDVELEASTIYCHNCGAAAGISDVYCRQCGTQLRR